MAGIKITDLPAAPSALLTDVFPVDQTPGPVTYKESNYQLLTLFQSNGAALTRTNDTNVTLTLGGSSSSALLNSASITAGWSGTLSGTRGGTGVNNGASTITLGGSLTTSGAFSTTFTITNTTAVTFPTSGTLATTSQLPTPAALTKTDDTNVTLTLGGTPSTALLQATSLTLGWTGQLSLARGGTNANLTASNGGIFYSTGTSGAILSGTATAGQMLQSGASTTPAWSTPTYPGTSGTSGKVLISDGTNNVYSTPTFPNASATTRKIIVSDGTNWVASTETYAVPGTSGNVLTSDGTNWTSAAPASGGIAWANISGTTQAAAVNTGYVVGNASQTTVTLPATAALGAVISVQGKGAAGWILAANTGQTIKIGQSTTSSAGSLTSANQYDSVSVVCITANTTWSVTRVLSTGLTVA